MQKKFINFKVVIPILLGLFLIPIIYFETQSPAYLFVNNTNTSVHTVLVSNTSPGVSIDLEPGQKQFVDMPFWWHAYFPKTENGQKVKPRLNLIIFQIYYLSDLPPNKP